MKESEISNNTKLTSARVRAVFMDCLFKEGEDHTNHIKAEGIVSTVGFHPDRLNSHKVEIAAMLEELPDAFKQVGGGGMSFLQACVDKHGTQWGEH